MKNSLVSLVVFSSVVALMASGCVEDDDGGNPPTEEPPASTVAFATAFAGAGRMITEIAAPLSESGVTQDDADDTAKSDVQEGLGGTRSDLTALTDPSCISFSWAGLTATITYDQCVSEETNEVIDGGLTVGMTLIPVRFFVTMDNLTIGETLFDGTITLSFSGTRPNVTTQLAFDLVVDNGSQNQIDLSNATLTVATGTVAIDGSGSFSDGTFDVTFTANNVTWTGDCLPTSGSVDFDDGTFNATIEFLPTTPDDGIVLVSVLPFVVSEPTTIGACN